MAIISKNENEDLESFDSFNGKEKNKIKKINCRYVIYVLILICLFLFFSYNNDKKSNDNSKSKSKVNIIC